MALVEAAQADRRVADESSAARSGTLVQHFSTLRAKEMQLKALSKGVTRRSVVVVKVVPRYEDDGRSFELYHFVVIYLDNKQEIHFEVILFAPYP